MRVLRVRCPNPRCRVILAIPREIQGQRVKCAGCGQSFPVPISLADRSGVKNRLRKAG